MKPLRMMSHCGAMVDSQRRPNQRRMLYAISGIRWGAQNRSPKGMEDDCIFSRGFQIQPLTLISPLHGPDVREQKSPCPLSLLHPRYGTHFPTPLHQLYVPCLQYPTPPHSTFKILLAGQGVGTNAFLNGSLSVVRAEGCIPAWVPASLPLK